MSSAGWVLGYHGCDAELGEAILRGEKTLLPGKNDYDWLGTGIYFWEGDPKRALEWARSAKLNPKRHKTTIENPFVLGAIIDLGACLDLMESDSLEKLKRAYAIFESQDRVKPKNEGSLANPGRRKLDFAVVNFLHDLLELAGETPFDSVRALFPEGDELYPEAGFLDRTHVQIAVRKESSVIGYFRPKLERL
jgi:hypothetical protein